MVKLERLSGRWQTVIGLGLVIAWLGLGSGALYASDLQVKNARRVADVRQIPPLEPPSPVAVKALAGGFNRAAADAMWLTTIQYFGGGNPNETYSALPSLLSTVVTVDPNFEYPYLFGGLVLPWQSSARAALELLEAGMSHFPSNGLMPYYAGAIARLQLKDNHLAAAYFERASKTPGAPRAATLLAGVSLTDLDNRQVALAWWDGVLETSTDATIRERATAWRDHLELILTLESLIKKVEETTGQPVQSLNDLVVRRALLSIPLSPLGRPLRYDATTRRVELDQ